MTRLSLRRLRQWYTGRRSMPRYYIQPGRKMRPSKERFASKLSQDTTSPPHRKKLIWWLPDNSAPGLTAASLNHAEYQRRALPVKSEKRKAVVMTQNATPVSEDEMVKSGQHQ